MPDITELRRYAAIDPDDPGELLEACMESAQLWLEGAGVPRMEKNRLYDMAVYMLATHYYDRRGAIYEDNRGSVSKSSEHVPFGVMSIMHQLRTMPPESGSDGEASG
ncbi:head-tail connector protein [Eubacteriales bacterium OttesenSCG-928-A19]|nr:head-tail connector protein [Eubacteriales bacterium OttesenSCG-928-A19]